ncbi:YopX family protein [Lysinibacillus sphaericus]|uniref:YopX family protein n=1 Tax=Lysinibacillus sphaericus TaxID=1421 RepID=UPI003F79EF45
MSREIKYQAFVVVQKLDNLGPNMHLAGVSEYEVMIDVHNISFDKGKVDYITDLEGDEYTFADKNLIAIREYTGLKDKNGKEIFEGDVVQRKGHKYQIAFEIGSFMLVKVDEENTDMYEEFDDCWNDHVYPLSQLYWNNNYEENRIHDLEILGNIHEHKHLLEATA